MPQAKLTTEERLVKYKISIERYHHETASLLAAGFTQQQSDTLILQVSSKRAVESVLMNYQRLSKPPYNLSLGQIVAMVSNGGGAQALENALESNTREPEGLVINALLPMPFDADLVSSPQETTSPPCAIDENSTDNVDDFVVHEEELSVSTCMAMESVDSFDLDFEALDDDCPDTNEPQLLDIISTSALTTHGFYSRAFIECKRTRIDGSANEDGPCKKRARHPI